MKVSAIITTYRRPDLLLETIRSLLNQTCLPAEILVGDDSPDDNTQTAIVQISASCPAGLIRYYRHQPALKECKNADFLYNQACGDFILHLHDDDPIFKECIELLAPPLVDDMEVVASFGLQRLIDDKGAFLNEPEIVNNQYFRTEARSGLVNGLHAAALQMFPNNGFLVRADAARSVGYDDQGYAGYATDFYFGLRLGRLRKPFYFVNQFTSMVRMTATAQSRNNPKANNASRSLQILTEEFPSFADIPQLETAVRQKIPVAISEAATLGDLKQGWKWYFSEYHRDQIVSIGGARRAAKLLLATVHHRTSQR